VNKLGKSSVTYEIGVFERGKEQIKAVGSVYMCLWTGKQGTEAEGMELLTEGLGKLIVEKAHI